MYLTRNTDGSLRVPDRPRRTSEARPPHRRLSFYEVFFLICSLTMLASFLTMWAIESMRVRSSARQAEAEIQQVYDTAIEHLTEWHSHKDAAYYRIGEYAAESLRTLSPQRYCDLIVMLRIYHRATDQVLDLLQALAADEGSDHLEQCLDALIEAEERHGVHSTGRYAQNGYVCVGRLKGDGQVGHCVQDEPDVTGVPSHSDLAREMVGGLPPNVGDMGLPQDEGGEWQPFQEVQGFHWRGAPVRDD